MLNIDHVEWRGDHLLYLSFDNGVDKVVNVSPLLSGPVFEPLRDPAQLSHVAIDPVARTVVWPNGADLAPEALYELEPVGAVQRPDDT